MLRFIRRAAALARMMPTFIFELVVESSAAETELVLVV